MIRTLIVDDEQLARERLAQLVHGFDDVEIIGQAEDGEQAMELIRELQPDLVFLDIQMPGLSGMEVAASLPSPRPRIVFCTAYDQYAVDAFELHAVDYLLKPVSRARLEKALEHVRGLSGQAIDESIEKVGEAAGAFPSRFLATRKSKYCVVPTADVLYFASEGGETRLQTAEQHYWMQPTLTDLETRLDPQHFCRISRAAIVHLDAVREIQPGEGGVGEVTLSDGKRLEVSRRRFRTLMDRLGRS